ncbi:hypothetical protein H5395_12320 [Paracoccus sp. MC1854]|uniref:hypothetical protein n=1 Tax=Paracoccus sp. MC1854 TaxID=2760306 RepID=UPI001602F986|nr:hypothetical protein [Paracoccus sp. MC1854]MBB1492307.1 hypothetical protein [Paracoccus sp. MC1854]
MRSTGTGHSAEKVAAIRSSPIWAIIVHGGAGEVEPEEAEANRSGCLRALAAGQAVPEGDGCGRGRDPGA